MGQYENGVEGQMKTAHRVNVRRFFQLENDNENQNKKPFNGEAERLVICNEGFIFKSSSEEVLLFLS